MELYEFIIVFAVFVISSLIFFTGYKGFDFEDKKYFQKTKIMAFLGTLIITSLIMIVL